MKKLLNWIKFKLIRCLVEDRGRMKYLLGLGDRDYYYVYAPYDNGKIIEVHYDGVASMVYVEVVGEDAVGPGDEVYLPMILVKKEVERRGL